MGKVIKRSGRIEAFSAAKIKRGIERAAKDARLSPSDVRKLVLKVAEPLIKLNKNKRLVKVTDLRRAILGRLERKAKRVSAAWRRFDKKRH